MPLEDKLAEAQSAFDAGRYNDALEMLPALIGEGRDHHPVVLLAETFEQLGLTGEAAEAFEHAAGRAPAETTVLIRRAARLYFDSGRRDKALALAARLRRDDPQDPEAAAILASLSVLNSTSRPVAPTVDDMIASDDPDQLLKAVRLIGSDVRDERNLALFRKMRRLYPQDSFIRQSLIGFAREFCDYAVLEAEETALRAEIASGNIEALKAETPHYNLMWCADEALNRLAANVSELAPPAANSGQVRLAMEHRWAPKLRVGYLSNDFWDDHATMRLLQSVLMAHDPARFDITLFCYTDERFIGFDRGNRQSWGRIVRIADLGDDAAVEAIRAAGIDILVDLKGHTGGSRSRLMNRPIAPVHVQWLGFPGSCIHIDCDYVIGDPFVLPESSKPHYHEKFCRLPESYQPNDPVFRALPAAAARRDVGLPEDRFVFSAFNSQRKNSPHSMALWARVLKANPHAVLWLMCDGDTARSSTMDYFRRLGAKPDQVIFAPKMAYERHLARAQAADLGLDSFPYNGHTTTSDMLWAGLPVVTVKGSNFASRVSESLLNAIDLSELVANDADHFVELCTSLAGNPEQVAALKNKLSDNRYEAPLFDAERFCRHLEAAYETMAERARAKLAPDHFDVPSLPRKTTP